MKKNAKELNEANLALKILLKMTRGKANDYRITDQIKLHKVANRLGIQTDNRDDNDIAMDVGLAALADILFGAPSSTRAQHAVLLSSWDKRLPKVKNRDGHRKVKII